MYSKLIFSRLVVVLTISFVLGTSLGDGDTVENRIVGGFPISIKDAPYQVSLQNLKKEGRSSHFCGGSIISENFVVTANHCVKNVSAKKIVIVAGTTDHKAKGVKVRVEKIFSHAKYNAKTDDYDIALLKLAEPLKFSQFMQPIALPEFNETVPDDTKCRISGWGDKKPSIFMKTSELRAADVPIVNQTTCEKNYRVVKHVITSRMVCAGFLKRGGKDSCKGDSGGPLACKIDESKQLKLFGIVSFGYYCGDSKFPGVYSRISELRHWIFDKSGL